MSGKQMLLVLLSVAALGSPLHANAQEATERYIPIGQSPGLSRGETYVGECVRYDPEERLLQMSGAAGARSIRITEDTHIWLDRSRVRRTNLAGDADDLVPGRRIEVKYVDPNDKSAAEWVKVEVSE
jgi:hypothetical protein